jgi:sugar (pentulose or hexulose) kinase
MEKEKRSGTSVFDIPDEMMCDLVEPGETIGHLTLQAAEDLGLNTELKLIATGTDKACEVLGLGCVNKKRAAISFGTTATITFTTDHYLEPENFIPPYDSILPGHYTPEVEIFRGYWLISWFKKEFAQKEVAEAIEKKVQPEEILNQRLKEVPAGCGGLVLQPYFTPNLTMPEAKGAVIGLSDMHTRIHLYRAIIEGINFALMDGMRHMEKRGGFRFEEIRVGGGGAQSSEICQITADMFGIPVVRTQTYEVSGIGSAIPAFVALGVYKNYKEALSHMVFKKEVFQPDKKQHRIYRKLYEEIYLQIYPRLSEIYAKIGEI